jgi:GR25 family glycosyltransferase involved in LPS biosynthesis
MINDYFDRVVCINLDRRTDRWAECVELFAKHDLRVERVSAVDGRTLADTPYLKKGMLGCVLSHRNVYEAMMASSDTRILILEDDVDFVSDLQAAFERAVIPQWDLLYLGGYHLQQPQPVNPGIARITKTTTTSQYAVTRNMAARLVKAFQMVNEPPDITLCRFQAVSAAYTFHPPLAWQRPGMSDIEDRHTDYRDRMLGAPPGRNPLMGFW